MAQKSLCTIPKLQQTGLLEAQKTTARISEIFQAAERDAAVPFQQTGSDWNSLSLSVTALATVVTQVGQSLSQPGSETLTARERMAQLLSIIATALDMTALGISTSGVIVEGVFAALGIASPIPGDEALGLAAGIKLYNGILNPIENALGRGSLALVIMSDILSGATHAEQGEWVLGPDTTMCLWGIALGNTFLTPEAATDTAANIGMVYYDVQRLREQEPFWGLVQLRVVLTPGDLPHFRITDEHGQTILQDLWERIPPLLSGSK